MTKVKVSIGPREQEFVLVETNAPQAYDHGAALELYDGTIDGKIDRYVLIPAEALEWQRLRNMSGMHTLTTDDLTLDADDVAQYLWKQIYQVQPYQAWPDLALPK